MEVRGDAEIHEVSVPRMTREESFDTPRLLTSGKEKGIEVARKRREEEVRRNCILEDFLELITLTIINVA